MSGEQDENGEVSVTFTVKELLSEIRIDVKEMRFDLSKKADASEVNMLKLQYETHEKSLVLIKDQVAEIETLKSEVEALKTQQVSAQAVDSYRTWLKRAAWGTVLTMFIAGINLVTRLFQWPS